MPADRTYPPSTATALRHQSKIPLRKRGLTLTDLTIKVLISCSKQDSIPHIPVITRAFTWQIPLFLLGQFALLVVVSALMGRHLGGEDTGRDGVDPDLDPLGGDLGREEFGQVVGGAFGCVVGKVVLGALYHAGDGAWRGG